MEQEGQKSILSDRKGELKRELNASEERADEETTVEYGEAED